MLFEDLQAPQILEELSWSLRGSRGSWICFLGPLIRFQFCCKGFKWSMITLRLCSRRPFKKVHHHSNCLWVRLRSWSCSRCSWVCPRSSWKCFRSSLRCDNYPLRFFKKYFIMILIEVLWGLYGGSRGTQGFLKMSQGSLGPFGGLSCSLRGVWVSFGSSGRSSCKTLDFQYPFRCSRAPWTAYMWSLRRRLGSSERLLEIFVEVVGILSELGDI